MPHGESNKRDYISKHTEYFTYAAKGDANNIVAASPEYKYENIEEEDSVSHH